MKQQLLKLVNSVLASADISLVRKSIYESLRSQSERLDLDFLSIDTEGSEYEIVSTLEFAKYKFKIITVEHNYQPNRKKSRNYYLIMDMSESLSTYHSGMIGIP